VMVAARERGIRLIGPDWRLPGAADLNALFAPASVALVGASNTPKKMGNLIMERLQRDYRGRIIPIHPREAAILGVEAYPSLGVLQEPVDLLIALIPGEKLLELVENCPPGLVKYLLAIPSGFGEVSDAGRVEQTAIVEAARERGIRVVGPNCMGLVNAVLGLNASLAPEMPPGGAGLSFVTQSGGFGIAATMYALDHQLPIAKICDLGNTADVQAWEVMRYLKDDPDTIVAGVLLECTGDSEIFLSALSELASAKPAVVTLLGRTEAGKRASQAHLGLESDPEIVEKIAATGAIYAETGRDLFNFAKSLAWQPKPEGNRVAIMVGTGGIGSELADLAAESGLEVPELSETVQQALTGHLPAFAGFANPVDLTPIWWQYPEAYPAVLRVLLDAENIDSVILAITDVATGIDALGSALADLQQERSAAGLAIKPIFVFWGARDDMLSNMRVLEASKIPCFRTTLETIRAVAASTGAGRQKTETPGTG